MRRLEPSGSPEQDQAESKDPQGKNRRKRAGAQGQKAKILKNSYSCPHKHLRSSKTAKYPNFRTKRAGQPEYEGRPFFAPKKEYRDYAHILNSKHAKTGTKIPPWRFRLLYYLLSTYFSAVAGVCAHKTIPFMQNKANSQSPANEPNLSYNKHLRK